MELSLSVSPSQAGRPLKSVMRNELCVSAAALRRLKAAGALYVNGAPVYANYVLSEGDLVTVPLDLAEEPPSFPAQDGELDILYEDEFFLAVNKPAGLLTHPSRSRYTDTLANYVLGYLGPGCGCHSVNRLDRDTSGAVLFAKSFYAKSLAAVSLSEAKKEYLAVVCGVPEEPEGRIDLPIKRLREGDMLRGVSPDGQSAVTNYRVLASEKDFSLLKLSLETGRTHQIRVHCLAIGCPLLGDKLYSTQRSLAVSEALELTAQQLHACRLQFTQPCSKRRLDIEAPVRRQDMLRLIKKLCFTA